LAVVVLLPAEVDVSKIDELALEIAELSARVQMTEDTLAIYDLKARYGELVDQRYWRGSVVDGERLDAVCSEIAKLFATDAVWDGGPTLGRAVGRDAICDRMHQTTLVFSRHLFVKPRIRIEGNEARGRWEILCPCKTADGQSFWMCGYEDDEYVRTDDSLWVHRSMSLTTVFFSSTEAGWERIFA
jgi:hypothetical protein